MNRIELDKTKKYEIEKLHKDSVKRILLHGNMSVEKSIKKKYSELCKKIDSEIKKIGLNTTFNELIIADYKTIKGYILDLSSRGYNFGSYSKKNIAGKPFKRIYEAYDKLIGVGYNRVLIDTLNISVCPYCNRDFVNNRGSQSSVQLDHFYPRSEFPIFAICLYNLVPSCYACNHIKSDNLISISPYDIFSVDELLTFSYSIIGSDFISDINDIKLEIIFSELNGKSLKNNFDILHLKQAYSLHEKEVQSILRKLIVFNETKIDEILYLYGDIFSSREEIVEDIFGAYQSRDYLNNILSKLKSDIYNESRSYI